MNAVNSFPLSKPIDSLPFSQFQFCAIILSLFFICVDGVSADNHAINKQLILTPEEIAYLDAHPVIRVHAEENWPPFNYIQYGQPKGFVNDYIRLLSDVSGLKFEFVTGYSWDEFVEMLKNQDIDLISNMTKTPERQKQFVFSEGGVVDVAVGLLARKGQPMPAGLDSIRNNGQVLGVVKGFYHEELLKRHYPEIVLLLANDIPELIQLVEQGRADVGLSSYAPFAYYLSNTKNSAMKSRIILKHSLFFPSTEHLAFNKSNRLLKGIIDKAMRLVSDDQVSKLKSMWPVALEQKDDNSGTHWSVLEKQYFAENQVIKMCVDPDWMPLESIQQGKHVGVAADVIRLIQQQLGVPIQLVETRNWEETLSFAKSRRCDILSMAMDTPERRAYLSFTDPYLVTPLVVAAKREALYLADVSKAVDKKIGLVKGYASSELLREAYPQLSFVDIDSVKDGLDQVERGTLFGVGDALNIIGYEIKRNYPEIKIVGKFEELWYLGIGVRNDRPVLLRALNNAIKAIPEEKVQAITNKWISVRYEKSANFSDVWKYIPFVILALGIVAFRQYLLKKYNKKLELISYTDTLTRCANRQKIDEVLVYQVNDYQRHESAFSVLLCDIDHFKKVNDQFGHLVGDKVLKQFACLLKNNIRANDLVGRWGGEEFLIVCPNTDSEGAEQVALHLKACLATWSFGEVGAVTASIGVAEYNDPTMTIAELLSRADQALYASKSSGRNSVTVYQG